jgi:hypothetical protein
MALTVARALDLGRLRTHLSPLRLTVAAVAVAGIAARVVIYGANMGATESDEAAWGLMARHLLHGELSTFFWNQAYGGSQEVFLTAPIFAAFGSSLLALRAVPIVLNVVAVILVWRVGRRTIGEPAATVAAALYWIWPPFTLFKLDRQGGFYGSGVVYCTLLLLLALQIRERPTKLRVGAFGLVAGLAFWQTAQIVPIAAGVIAWLAWKQPRAFRLLWIAVPLALVGALPWILWNLHHGWASLHLTGGSTSLPGRYRYLVDSVFPIALGLRVAGSSAWLVPTVLAGAIYAALIVLFVRGAIKWRHRDVSLLYVVTAVFLALNPLSSKTFVTNFPIYIVILMPVLALLAAQPARNLRRAIPLLLVLGLVSGLGLEQWNTWRKTAPADITAVPRSFTPLIHELDRLGIDRVYADYWIAYRLDFETRERIIAVEGDFKRLAIRNGRLVPPPVGTNILRYPPYDARVRNARHANGLLKQTAAELHIGKQLERNGFVLHSVGPFVVYAPRPR